MLQQPERSSVNQDTSIPIRSVTLPCDLLNHFSSLHLHFLHLKQQEHEDFFFSFLASGSFCRNLHPGIPNIIFISIILTDNKGQKLVQALLIPGMTNPSHPTIPGHTTAPHWSYEMETEQKTEIRSFRTAFPSPRQQQRTRYSPSWQESRILASPQT